MRTRRRKPSRWPDFRVTTWAPCIDPPFAKLIRGCWFATVVVMSERSPKQIHAQIRKLLDSLYRVDSGRILASLIRLPGDFDLAEEKMHEAFAAALSLWPRSGVPGTPRPWLISTARFKGIARTSPTGELILLENVEVDVKLDHWPLHDKSGWTSSNDMGFLNWVC
jgi:hypothetical protein